MSAPIGFAARLVWWRKRRGLRPSREMVLPLAAALDVPLRHSAELLLAAGFAPVWRDNRPSRSLMIESARAWLSIAYSGAS